MKIQEILTESTSDIVARFYKESSLDSEKKFNPENVKYKSDNKKYYEDYFKTWESTGIAPVFTKPVTPAQPKYSVTPKADDVQSPGYRGIQNALSSAGLPHNKDVQPYQNAQTGAIIRNNSEKIKNQ